MLKGVLWSSFLVAILVPPFPFFYARHSMGAGHPTPPVAKSLMPASSLSAHILFIIHHYSFICIYIFLILRGGGGFSSTLHCKMPRWFCAFKLQCVGNLRTGRQSHHYIITHQQMEQEKVSHCLPRIAQYSNVNTTNQRRKQFPLFIFYTKRIFEMTK